MVVSKIALVTGAAVGYKKGGPSIGSAIAYRLAEEGYSVVVVDILDVGKKTAETIRKRGGKSIFIKADLSRSKDARRVIKVTESEYGRLDCLVNCVARYGKGMAKNVVDISEEEWDKTLDVNLNGYYRTIKYAVPLMLKSGGGAIINLSSIESAQSLPNFAVYSVSKAAIDALTRCCAVDFAPKIRTNSVAPGFVRIENSQNNRTPNELRQWYKEIATQYPMKRVCEVDEIAYVVSFLASEKSSYINGQTIIVDGGKSISDMHKF